MPDIANPYIAGSPVTGKEMFFGREDVFSFVHQALTGQHRDNVLVLYGQRRTGKTSVLYQMSRHIGDRYYCIFIDLHGLALESLDGFLWELANMIARSLRKEHSLAFPVLNRSEFFTDPRSYFETIFLDAVWAAIGDHHILLMLDEAVRLEEQVRSGKLDNHVFEYLRHLMQHYEKLNFLFSLGSGLEEMEKEYAFLFNVALYKKISFLDRQAALDLISQPVKDLYQVDPAAIETILRVTSGHAYYTQLICHSLFNYSQNQGIQLIRVQDVDAILGEVVERGLAVLKQVWEESTPAEKAVMAAIETLHDSNQPTDEKGIVKIWSSLDVRLPPGEMAQAMQSLIARDVLIDSPKGWYVFTVDLQRLWVQKYQRMDWVKEEISAEIEQWNTAPQPRVIPRPASKNSREKGYRIGGVVLLLLFVAGIVVYNILKDQYPPWGFRRPPTPAPTYTLIPSLSPSTTPTRAGPHVLVVITNIDGLALRSKPLDADNTVIKILPLNSPLFVLDPVEEARGKIGVTDQWLNVADLEAREGYVLAQYVSLGRPTPTPETASTAAPVSGLSLARPVDAVYPITQYFGENPQVYPATHGHDGIDFGVPTGTQVYASTDGVVSAAGTFNPLNGLEIRIDLQNQGSKIEIVYRHLSKIVVDKDQVVKKGQLIALSGNTGQSSGPHLHLGLIMAGQAIDPLPYLSQDAPQTTATPVSQTSHPFVPPAVISQRDPAWKDTVIGNGSDTIDKYGSLLTSLTMLVNGYGYAETPLTLNEKLISKGGYQNSQIVISVISQIFPNIRYADFIQTTSPPAPMSEIDAALASGQPVLVGLDVSPAAGVQNQWVVLYAKKGDDYLILDPWPYPADQTEVLLTQRYGSAGTPGQIIQYIAFLQGPSR